MKKPVNNYSATYPVDSKVSYYANCESGNSSSSSSSTTDREIFCNGNGFTDQVYWMHQAQKEKEDGWL